MDLRSWLSVREHKNLFIFVPNFNFGLVDYNVAECTFSSKWCSCTRINCVILVEIALEYASIDWNKELFRFRSRNLIIVPEINLWVSFQFKFETLRAIDVLRYCFHPIITRLWVFCFEVKLIFGAKLGQLEIKEIYLLNGHAVDVKVQNSSKLSLWIYPWKRSLLEFHTVLFPFFPIEQPFAKSSFHFD